MSVSSQSTDKVLLICALQIIILNYSSNWRLLWSDISECWSISDFQQVILVNDNQISLSTHKFFVSYWYYLVQNSFLLFLHTQYHQGYIKKNKLHKTQNLNTFKLHWWVRKPYLYNQSCGYSTKKKIKVSTVLK